MRPSGVGVLWGKAFRSTDQNAWTLPPVSGSVTLEMFLNFDFSMSMKAIKALTPCSLLSYGETLLASLHM